MKANLSMSFCLAALLANAAAHADTTVRMKHEGGVTLMSVKSGVVAMQEEGQKQGSSIFDAQRKLVINLNHEQRMYIEMDQAFHQRMRDQLKAQLQNMPAEQRRMIEQQMQQGAPKMGFKPTGQNRTVNGMTCQTVEIIQDGKPAGTACVAKSQQLGMDAKDYATVNEMMNFMASVAGGDKGGMGGLGMDELGGIPVEMQDSSGKVLSQLLEVKNQPLAGDAFQVPAGYQKFDPMARKPAGK